jgi:hypothetical protein
MHIGTCASILVLARESAASAIIVRTFSHELQAFLLATNATCSHTNPKATAPHSTHSALPPQALGSSCASR